MFHKILISSAHAPRARRGAVGKGCLIAGAVGGVLLALLLLVGGVVMSKYNSLTSGQQNVQARWSEIDNQYKRRFDLVPQLVETVKGAANFEKSTLNEVTEARASVARVALPEGAPTDPEKLKAYVQAQQSLGGALSRLFAVAESYPQLKATANFLTLQDQLEGTENRIATARRDYIDAVQSFNTQVKSFPGNLIAGMFDFEPATQLEIAPAERAAPKVQFDFDKK